MIDKRYVILLLLYLNNYNKINNLEKDKLKKDKLEKNIKDNSFSKDDYYKDSFYKNNNIKTNSNTKTNKKNNSNINKDDINKNNINKILWEKHYKTFDFKDKTFNNKKALLVSKKNEYIKIKDEKNKYKKDNKKNHKNNFINKNTKKNNFINKTVKKQDLLNKNIKENNFKKDIKENNLKEDKFNLSHKRRDEEYTIFNNIKQVEKINSDFKFYDDKKSVKNNKNTEKSYVNTCGSNINIPKKLAYLKVQEVFSGNINFPKYIYDISNIKCKLDIKNVYLEIDSKNKLKGKAIYDGILKVSIEYLEPKRFSKNNLTGNNKFYVFFIPFKGNKIININFVENINLSIIKKLLVEKLNENFNIYKSFKNKRSINEYIDFYKSIHLIIETDTRINLLKKVEVKL